MKKLLSIVLILVFCLSLAACGGVDRQPAIDAFNAANTAFTEVANIINAAPDEYPEDIIDGMISIGNALAEHKAMLEGKDELSEEQLAEMIAWYASVEEVIAETKVELNIE